LSLARRAQQAESLVPIVGVLVWGTEANSRPFVDAIRDGMRDNGFVDGVNVRLRAGYGDTAEQLPDVSRGLAAAGSRLIVASGTTAVRAAHESLPSMPIVMAGSADPVATRQQTQAMRFFASHLTMPLGR
jgi:putative ABC transport system substrate-binding protein